MQLPIFATLHSSRLRGTSYSPRGLLNPPWTLQRRHLQTPTVAALKTASWAEVAIDEQQQQQQQMRGMEFTVGLENDPLIATIHHLMDFPEELEKVVSAPARAYVRDRKAMASTPADVKEVPGAVVFEIDMPGVKHGEIKVQVEEDDRTLLVIGERRRAEEKEANYKSMERRMGKFMRRFQLPEDANVDAINAAYRDGVLVVRVEKRPPPEPKKPKNIEVKVDGGSSEGEVSRVSK